MSDAGDSPNGDVDLIEFGFLLRGALGYRQQNIAAAYGIGLGLGNVGHGGFPSNKRLMMTAWAGRVWRFGPA